MRVDQVDLGLEPPQGTNDSSNETYAEEGAEGGGLHASMDLNAPDIFLGRQALDGFGDDMHDMAQAHQLGALEQGLAFGSAFLGVEVADDQGDAQRVGGHG
jgi:hypothetical protein